MAKNTSGGAQRLRLLVTLLMLGGQAVLGMGVVVWIYPPCRGTCDLSRQATGFMVLTMGLAMFVVGIAVAVRHWVRTAAGATRRSAGGQAERPWLEPLGLDDRVSKLGLPLLIIGVFVLVAGALTDLGPTMFPRAASPGQIADAANLLDSGLLLTAMGWLAMASGYLMEWWSDAMLELKEKALVLMPARGSIWSVTSAMLQKERGGEPASVPASQHEQRRTRRRLVTGAEGRIGVGTVLVAVGALGVGVSLFLMIDHLTGFM